VEELCLVLGVSREILRQKFHAVLGKSPKQVIDEMRSDIVSEHLRHSEDTVEEIAIRCGFSGSDDLCRFFKRTKGSTISEWRRMRSGN
jgi:LacI family transcriptional regulator